MVGRYCSYLCTAQVGWQNIQNLSQQAVFTVLLCHLVHAIWWQWDTVIFLLSMSQNFSSNFDINVPLLSHPQIQVLSTLKERPLLSYSYILPYFAQTSIPLRVSTSKLEIHGTNIEVLEEEKIREVLSHLTHNLISSVPVSASEFWYRPTVTVPLSSYCVYLCVNFDTNWIFQGATTNGMLSRQSPTTSLTKANAASSYEQRRSSNASSTGAGQTPSSSTGSGSGGAQQR